MSLNFAMPSRDDMLRAVVPKKPPDPLLRPRWAQVSSLNPLRVQMYGDDSPVDCTPETLAGGLRVGDTVWTTLSASGALVVVGRLGGSNPTELGADVDLDTLLETATYTQSQSVEATLALNYPAVRSGLLEVFQNYNLSMTYQRYTLRGATDSGSGGGIWYERGCWTGTSPAWSPWYRYIPADPVELGASVNLNTLTASAVYTQGDNVQATTALNYPAPAAGLLEVFTNPTASMVWQRYTTYLHASLIGIDQNGPTQYIRAMYPAGTWSTWQGEGGSDVISGTVAAQTWYWKKADGELICRGYESFAAVIGTQNITWTFPVAFVGEYPEITVIEDTTVPQNVNASLGGLSLTSVNIYHYRSTAVVNKVWFAARGRWK